MSDPATTIQAAADTVSATHALITSILAILPTLGYAITIAAAFFPKPDDNDPAPIKFAYKAINAIAFNIKHARNIADDRRKEHRQPDETFQVEESQNADSAN